jgi:RING-like zinc finger
VIRIDICPSFSCSAQRGRLGCDHRRDLHQIFQLCRTLFPHCHIKHVPGWTQDRLLAHQLRIFGVAVVFVRHRTSCLPHSLLIVAACLPRPILTFLTILFIPSSLTFLTLVIHRIRAAHAAQRERAPEDVVKSLPWRVWTGSGWEKHEGVPLDKQDQSVGPVAPSDSIDVELGQTRATNPTTSAQTDEDEDPAWFNTQVECAICLDGFVKGDRVRVLPCKHIFHLDEVDEWLIQLKKLVSCMSKLSFCFCVNF